MRMITGFDGVADCVHACAECRFVWTHVPNCDDGEDDSWLCDKCETARAKKIRRQEATDAIEGRAA